MNQRYKAWLRQWIEARYHNPEKMHLVPYIERCLKIASSWENEICCFETFDNKKYDYRFMGGFGNFKHLRFSKKLYISKYFRRDDWKNAEPDELIYTSYKSRTNDRYLQTDVEWKKDRPYVLVPLQFLYPKDYFETISLIEWATKNKIYTIFKRHPASSSQTQTPRDYDKFWSVVERMGITSEYTHFPVDNYNANSMIKQCDMMISVDSAMTLQAMLHNKPTVNLRRCMISDIIPILDHTKLDDSVKGIKPIDLDTQMKWLTWYWKSCVNNYDADNFSWKINRRRDLYRNGATDLDLHSWEYTKNNGLHD